MYRLTPSHTSWTNASNSNAGSALSGHGVSERVVHDRGLNDDGTPDNSIERVYFRGGEMLNAAARWLSKQAWGAIERVDTALRFPVADGSFPPLLKRDGSMLRTRDMPPWIEEIQEVRRLGDSQYKPDFGLNIHKALAKELKETIYEIFKDSPVIIVSDQEHSWGRSALLRMHLMLAASKGEFVVLMDGTVKGKVKQLMQNVFKETHPVGLNRGLEADLPVTLTRLMFTHHEFFERQSLPKGKLDEAAIQASFGKLMTTLNESEAYRSAYKEFLQSSPPADKIPLIPFINTLADIAASKSQDVPKELTKWYVEASRKDREALTLLLKRMMIELAKSLDKEDARQVSIYLDDPKNKFDDICQELALRLRHRTWKTEIEAAYEKHGGKIPVVIFEGWKHDDYITKLVDELTKKTKKSKSEMKTEL